MPPKKKRAAAAAAVSSPPPSARSVASDAAAPAAAAASASAAPRQFGRAQSTTDLATGVNILNFMIKGIYQYLSQFGFEETAAHLKADMGVRFEPNPLTAQDETESHLRCSMYRLFTMSAAHAPNMSDSAEIILDDLLLLCNMSRAARDVNSVAFQIERETRVAACMYVVDDKPAFDEIVAQYFDASVMCTRAEADKINKAIAAGEAIADSDLRKQELYFDHLHLVDYQKNKAMVAKEKKTAMAKTAQAAVDKFESNHQRSELQRSVGRFLKDLLTRVRVQGAVLLEQVGFKMLDGSLFIGRDEDDGSEEEAEAEAEPMEDEQDADGDEPMEVPEEEEEEEEAPPSPPSPPKRRASPKKAARAAPAAAASAASSKASSKLVVPDAVRKLHAASKQLDKQGEDPLAQALRNTQALSKRKRKSREDDEESKEQQEADDEEAEEEDQPVELELEEEEEEVEAPVKRGRGRPKRAATVAPAKSKAAAAAAASLKYDRESKSAQKIEFSDDEGKEDAAEEDAEDDAEERASLPSFKGKKAPGALKTPTQLAPMDAGQSKRPVVHRHLHDRAAKRVPWSAEEISKLTDGVVEYASERKKWSLILSKYSEFFQDRTVVDLKDKWRNLKSKLGKVGGARKKAKVDNAIDESIEEIED